MGNTRTQITLDPLPAGLAPSRSCGPMGQNDAGDPNRLACMPGDTQGPVGTCGDRGAPTSSYELNVCVAPTPVAVLNLDRMRRLLRATAYAEAANNAAKTGFWGSDVDLGDQKKIEAEAARQADRMMEELLAAMATGPATLQVFIDALEKRKVAATSALRGKLDEAIKSGRKASERWGEAIKFCAGVKFISTVGVKTLGAFTGGAAGFAIDVVYSTITKAVDPAETKGVLAVGAAETIDNTKEEVIEELNELVAKGLMSKAERDQLKGWWGNYKGNEKKIGEQLEKIEQRLLKRVQQGKGVGKLAADQARKLAKLKQLRLKTAGKFLRSAGTYKKALGKGATLVFLAQDVTEAWQQLEKDYALAE